MKEASFEWEDITANNVRCYEASVRSITDP